MKRQNSDEAVASGDNKRQRGGYNDALVEGKFELRFLVPTRCAGPAIGRKGETINAIRQQFDALLQVPDRSTPERVFTMTVAKERVGECFAEVLDKIAERLMEAQPPKTNGEIELRILIHQSQAGAVIGKGGTKIKELREQTGAHLKVFKETCPNSTDRVLQVTAEKSKMPDVVKQLVDFISEIEIKGSQKPYDSSAYNPRTVFEYGGYASDKPFVAPPGAAPQAYNQPPVWSTGNGMYSNNVGSVSGPAPSAYVDQAAITTQVTIPNELAGTIIGRGGERINGIRQESGARIDIGQSIGTERVITIVGTQNQIHTAQYLLQQSVRASETGRRYLAAQMQR